MQINKEYLLSEQKMKAMGLSKMVAKGFTIHNTGNRNISSAKDEALNYYNNSWKKGAVVIVHFTVDENGVYQHIPINWHGWHASDGGEGFGNRQTIAIEIARDMDYNSDRYARAEKHAMELVAYLIRQFGVPANIKRHHDYDPWGQSCPHRMFEGKPNTWEQFLNGVSKLIDKPVVKPPIKPKPPVSKPKPSTGFKVGERVRVKTNAKDYNGASIASFVYENVYPITELKGDRAVLGGINTAFKTSNLLKQGSVTPIDPKPVKKTNTQLAHEVYEGLWGNGADRTNALKKAGYDPVAVQNEVNRIYYGGASKQPAKKTAYQVAWDILNTNHKWGNGNVRKTKLQQAGYNYDEVQRHINKMLGY